MAKVAVLVPYLEMREIARPMLEGYDHIQAMCVEYATTDTIAERARTLEAQGCELIVSRGLQARIIRPLLKIPVVEMRITAQELGSASWRSSGSWAPATQAGPDRLCQYVLRHQLL